MEAETATELAERRFIKALGRLGGPPAGTAVLPGRASSISNEKKKPRRPRAARPPADLLSCGGRVVKGGGEGL